MRRSLSTTLALLALLAVCAGCGPSADPPTVQTVAAPTTPTSAAAAGRLPSDRPAGPTTTTSVPAPAPDDLLALVDAALLRYDLALTALAARPDRAGDPASAERTAWAGVVVVGSPLDEAMVEEVVRRGTEEDGAVLPPPGGLSYRHRALTARPTPGGTSFTWCGHSPGIGVERSTGTVVDDAVGHAHGTGLVVLDGGSVRVAELEQTQLDVLAPGTPDPCPGEVRP